MRVTVSSGDRKSKGGLLVLLHDGTNPLTKSIKVSVAAQAVNSRFVEAKGESELYSLEAQSSATLFLSTSQVKHHTREEKLKTLAARALSFAEKHKLRSITIPAPDAATAALLAEGALIASYSFEKYKSKPKQPHRQTVLEVQMPASAVSAAKAAIARAQIISEAMAFTRDLVNEPAEAIYPASLGAAAQQMARRVGLQIEVLDEKALARGSLAA